MPPLYFAFRRTIEDQSTFGDSISQEGVLTICKIVRRHVVQVTADNTMEYSDDQILKYFLTANPSFQRRTNKLLHLITSYDLLEKLVGPMNSHEYNARGLEIDYKNNPIGNNEDMDSIESLDVVCQSHGIATIQDDIDAKNLADLTPLFTDSI